MKWWKSLLFMIGLLVLLAVLFSFVKGQSITLEGITGVFLWVVNLLLVTVLLCVVFLGPVGLGIFVKHVVMSRLDEWIDPYDKMGFLTEAVFMVIEAAIFGVIWMLLIPWWVSTDWSWLRALWIGTGWRAYETSPIPWGIYAAVLYVISYIITAWVTTES